MHLKKWMTSEKRDIVVEEINYSFQKANYKLTEVHLVSLCEK